MNRQRRCRRAPRVQMEIQNGDVHLGFFKIIAASNSATILLGDAECVSPRSVSYTRGVLAQTAFAPPVVAPGAAGGGGARA